MSDLYKISEFANRHGISRRSLIYYDQIGLLHPFRIDDNGYRYYATHQHLELSTILTLKELGMSLEQIKAIIDDRHPELLEDIYLNLLETIDHHIQSLENTKYALASRMKKHTFFKKIILETPQLTKNVHEVYSGIDISHKTLGPDFLENYSDLSTDTRILEVLDAPNILDGEPWGFSFKKDETQPTGYKPQKLLKRLHPSLSNQQLPQENLMTLSGEFLCAYTLNRPGLIKQTIQQLTHYATKHHLTLMNDELYILVWKDEVDTPHLHEHVLEITFPVKKHQPNHH